MSHSVIIGGAGFVGSWVVEEILKNPNAKVTIIDNLISSEEWNIPSNPRISFIFGSAADPLTFKNIINDVDYIYQLACFHGNQNSLQRPLDDLENSLKTTLTTLEWMKNSHPNSRLVYAGAGCAVAEKTWEVPVAVEEKEHTSLVHDSPYSISKISGEMYCVLYAKQYGLDILRVRFQNVYGPREILGAGEWRGTNSTLWRNVIPTFIWRALQEKDLIIYGQGSRDFIFVEDLASGILKAMRYGKTGEVYNLASGIETKINDLAATIKKLSNSKSLIKTMQKREWDNSGRRYADISKSLREINFKAECDLKAGLEMTIKWTVKNAPLIEKTILKHGIEDYW